MLMDTTTTIIKSIPEFMWPEHHAIWIVACQRVHTEAMVSSHGRVCQCTQSLIWRNNWVVQYHLVISPDGTISLFLFQKKSNLTVFLSNDILLLCKCWLSFYFSDDLCFTDPGVSSELESASTNQTGTAPLTHQAKASTFSLYPRAGLLHKQ